MNPFLNPYFLSQVLKSYLNDIDRLRKINAKSLKKIQDHNFRKIVRNAYTIPLYHEKYKKAGILPEDIKGIDDAYKLPFVTKEDLRKNFPDRTIPISYNKRKAVKTSTSGTAGRPVSIYVDMHTIIKGLLGYVRVLREHNINWRKTKITIIADLTENSAERRYLTDGMIPRLKLFFSLKNMQIFHTYDDAKKLIKEINSFQPDFIGGYPGMIRQLALLKKKGFGKNIWPRCIISSGAVLSNYLKKDFEETFNSQVFDAYGAMESGPIAFQCKHGGYHIHSDLVYLEVVDSDGEPVSSGKPGRIVVTRLYGGGTSIIRYIGLNDIITTMDGICDCGLAGGLIKKIYGRENQSIVLPGGKILLPSSISEFFDEISQRLNIDKIERFQLVQHKIDKIDILAAVDNDLRDTDPSVDKIFSMIKECFNEKFGSNIDINVRERGKFKPHTPGIISKVDRSKIKDKIYI